MKLDKTKQPTWIDRSMLNVLEVMITGNNDDRERRNLIEMVQESRVRFCGG